jgi:hypothetical protein
VIGNYKENENCLNGNSSEIFWEPVHLVEDYCIRNAVREIEGSTVRADWNVVPKAASPLASAVSSARGSGHQIIGHPQIGLVSLPRVLGSDMKYVVSTGTISLKTNDLYRRSQRERVAALHHSLGFLVVHKGFVWPVYATQGGDFNFFNWSSNPGSKQELASLGDIHYPMQDKVIVSQCQHILDLCNVRRVVLNDVIDFKAGSHHQYTYKDRFDRRGTSVTDELKGVAEQLTADWAGYEVNIVASNHHEHLTKWLSQPSQNVRPEDLMMWFELNALALRGYNLTRHILGDTHKYWSDLNPLMENEVLYIHGDKGVSGSRGTPNGFSKASYKITGHHTHTPSILRGYMNPASTKKLPSDYEGGLTASGHGMILQASTGKRQLISGYGNLLPTRLLDFMESNNVRR